MFGFLLSELLELLELAIPASVFVCDGQQDSVEA